MKVDGLSRHLSGWRAVPSFKLEPKVAGYATFNSIRLMYLAIYLVRKHY